MRIFEFPYVIITILVMCFIVMGAIGLYFVMKSVRTANEEEEKGIVSTNRLEIDFNKLTALRRNRCVIYVSVSTDAMKGLFADSKIMRILSQIRTVLIRTFAVNTAGNVALGGSGCFVVLSECEAKETVSLIESCHQEISKILLANEAVNMASVRFGFHSTVSNQVNFSTALSRAKQACAMAEDKTRVYCEWDNSGGKEFERKIKIENTIHSELDNNRFFLEYQPVVDAATGKIIGAEVLSRLNSEEDGILSPQAFLSAVNSVGLTEKFDYYIFEKNCKWISNDKERRSRYVYTINFSRSTLCNRDFASKITEIIDKYNLDYSTVAIEVLEDKSLSGDDEKIMTENLSVLNKKGMLILLDDFGRGYTSFTDLSSFDISVVKIDKAITGNALEPQGFVILKNIINTAKDLGFKTLCEGIETEEHRKVAIEAGCDMMQGYYFYRPMPVTKLEELLLKN